MTTTYAYVNCPSCNSIHTLGTVDEVAQRGIPEDMLNKATITITCPIGGITQTTVLANTDPTLADYLTYNPNEQEEQQ